MFTQHQIAQLHIAQLHIAQLHDAIEAVVFGNGWLALGGLAITVGITLAVRATRGITV